MPLACLVPKTVRSSQLKVILFDVFDSQQEVIGQKKKKKDNLKSASTLEASVLVSIQATKHATRE